MLTLRIAGVAVESLQANALDVVIDVHLQRRQRRVDADAGRVPSVSIQS